MTKVTDEESKKIVQVTHLLTPLKLEKLEHSNLSVILRDNESWRQLGLLLTLLTHPDYYQS
jgi:hypothetical protein